VAAGREDSRAKRSLGQMGDHKNPPLSKDHKEVARRGKNFVTLDGRNAVAFDVAPQRPLTFRIRWRNEAAEGIPDNGVLYAISCSGSPP